MKTLVTCIVVAALVIAASSRVNQHENNGVVVQDTDAKMVTEYIATTLPTLRRIGWPAISMHPVTNDGKVKIRVAGDVVTSTRSEEEFLGRGWNIQIGDLVKPVHNEEEFLLLGWLALTQPPAEIMLDVRYVRTDG